MAIELLRERALQAIEDEARLAGLESRDPRWSRGRGGPNVKRWAERGFHSAAAVVRNLAAEPGESLESWMTRASAELQRTRDLGPDDDDEAWFASAVDEARRILGDKGLTLRTGSQADLASFGQLARRGERYVALRGPRLTVFEGGTRRDVGSFPGAEHFLVSPDGRAAFIHHAGGVVHVDLDTGATTLVDRFGNQKLYVTCDAFVVGGALTLSFLSIWTWQGEQLPHLWLEHPDPKMDFGVRDLAITPDGRWLAVADNGEDREGGGFTSYESGEFPHVRLYDLQSRTCVARRKLGVYHISISPDGAVITTDHGKLRAPDLTPIDDA